MTTNGRGLSRLFVLCVPFLLHPAVACCGNLEMVEKNVEELESVNREALGKIEGLPENGTVDFKAYVTAEGGKPKVRIDETNITTKDAAGKKRQSKPQQPLTQVEVSAPPTEGKIEYLESNTPANTSTPGGGHVR